MDRSNREFTIYPGFIDRTVLLPSLCVQACSILGYNYAAIEAASFCFCKAAGTINSVMSSDSNCHQYTCPGDSGTYCGSQDYLVVYDAGPKTTVSLIEFENVILKFIL